MWMFLPSAQPARPSASTNTLTKAWAKGSLCGNAISTPTRRGEEEAVAAPALADSLSNACSKHEAHFTPTALMNTSSEAVQ
jgi:hypothetical protein